ncbi:MAG: polyprenyl synthetase family protein, partial [Chloroflexi bacterium]|nr:polyprenyl synthetase family protein [Chloroflexota bacterium]
LAMAWQINQDVADLWGQHGDGMTPSNVLDKKKSLPLIHALENAPISSKRELGNIYMKRVLQPEDVAQIITILDESGSRQFSLDKARELAQQAIERLDGSGLAQERLTPLRLLCQQELDGGTHG